MSMNKRFKAMLLLVLLSMTCGACTGRLVPAHQAPEPVRSRYAAVVTAAPGDTLESLARSWLKDGRKAWQIAAYNNINTVTPGQKVIIPLRPAARGGLQLRGYQTVPVLVYDHLVGTTSRKGRLSANDFEQQLRQLKTKGFTTLSLDDFHDFTSLKAWLPPLSVLICLDSTEQWVYEIAFPLLKQNGMQAAVFVAANAVGGKNQMTWEQLGQMTQAGFSIGSRGLTGRDLTRTRNGESTEAYLNRIDAEIRESRRALENKLNQPCLDFAYPNGAFNDFLIAVLKKHGYRSGYGRGQGSNPFFVDDFKIRRTRVAEPWQAKRFQEQLSTFRPMELR